jgi:hypothetical protein
LQTIHETSNIALLTIYPVSSFLLCLPEAYIEFKHGTTQNILTLDYFVIATKAYRFQINFHAHLLQSPKPNSFLQSIQQVPIAPEFF